MRFARVIWIIRMNCALIWIRIRVLSWEDVRKVALEVNALLGEMGLRALAEDEWFARHARERAHSATLDV